MPSLLPILAPECEGQGSQARCATLIDRLDGLVAASGLKPRLRDHGIAEQRYPDAGQGSDEADAPAGEQSLPDRRRGRAPALRGRLVSRPVAAGRDAYRWFMTIADPLGRQ